MFLISLISFLIIFSIIVLTHECWHYFVAKFFWVKIEEFGIWLPPRMKTLWTNKLWTKFILNWIPFWWYVKMKWESEFYWGSEKLTQVNNELAKKWNFAHVSFIWKVSIIIAGVSMNFILAWLTLALLFTFWTKPLLLSDQDVNKYSELWYVIFEEFKWITVMDFWKDSPWEKSWLEQWDIISKINWSTVKTKNDLSILNKQSNTLDYEILRNDSIINLKISKNDEWKIWVFLTDQPLIKEIKDMKMPFWESIIFSFKECIRIWILTIKWFWEMIANLFSKWESPNNVSWPIWMAKMSWMLIVNWSINDVFKFLALISLSLAVINIIPIPALDWWHLLFLILECIIWRKYTEHLSKYLNLVWFLFLISLMVFVTFLDIINIF